jgi:hypothetical protein
MNVAAACTLRRDCTKLYIQPEQARFKSTSITQIISVAEGCSGEQGREQGKVAVRLRKIDEGEGVDAGERGQVQVQAQARRARRCDALEEYSLAAAAAAVSL